MYVYYIKRTLELIYSLAKRSTVVYGTITLLSKREYQHAVHCSKRSRYSQLV